MSYKRNILFLIAVSFLSAQFDWINDGAPIRQGQHIEWQRTADKGADGEIIFGWSDTREGMRDVYVQKVDAEGNKVWGENGLPVAQAFGRQEDPLLVSDGAGGAFIIWIDYRSEPDTKGDVYAQHILSDGSLVWSIEGQPIVVKDGAQRNPNMCMDGNGGVFIIWKDFTVGQYEHVYATHINSNNEIIAAGTGIPIITNNSHHSGISLETAGNGEAAMVWVDDRSETLDIYGQRIAADHTNGSITTLWSTEEEGGAVICDASGDQNYAKITYAKDCCDDEGVTVATWQDDRNGNFDIYMQYLLADGTSYFEDYQQGLPLTSLPSSSTKPRVKADESGAYIAWFDDRNNNSDIYAQKVVFSQASPIVWVEEGLDICTNNESQTGVRLSVDGQGGVYFVWQDDRNGGDEADVYLQQISTENIKVYSENGFVISNANLIQKSPVVRNTANGSAFIVWEDGREGSGSIFMQYLSQSGEIIESNGKEMYYGVDGKSENIKSEKIDSDEILLYWEDHEKGVNSTFNFAKKITKDFGLSYDNAINTENKILSENSAQLNAEIRKVDDKLFLGFLQDNYQAQVDPFEGYSQYFQILDLPNLNLVGDPNGTWLNPSSFWQYSFVSEFGRDLDLSINDDNEVFYFTSLSEFFAGPDIYLRKIDMGGNIYWEAPINLTNEPSYDNFVKKAFNNPEQGSFLVYNQQGSENLGFVLSIDQDANIISGFPKRISDYNSDQFVEDAIKTDQGIFIVWKDNRSEDGTDIYGQLFDYSGNKLSENDIVIAAYPNDQSNAIITKGNDDSALVCWEDYSNGIDYDLYCNTIDLNTLEVNLSEDDSPLYAIGTGQGDQNNAFAYTALNGDFMLVWEDSRNNDEENLQIHTDIYYQQISESNLMYGEVGVPVCESYHIQTEPKIALYSNDDSQQSYLIYWSDLRSTGKDLLYNIYGQSITHDFTLDNNVSLIDEFKINDIYPNPFNPNVNINFNLPFSSYVSINIYDLNGRIVDVLYNSNLNYGEHNFVWNANNFSSGIYLLNINAGKKSITTKISLLK